MSNFRKILFYIWDIYKREYLKTLLIIVVQKIIDIYTHIYYYQLIIILLSDCKLKIIDITFIYKKRNEVR